MVFYLVHPRRKRTILDWHSLDELDVPLECSLILALLFLALVELLRQPERDDALSREVEDGSVRGQGHSALAELSVPLDGRFGDPGSILEHKGQVRKLVLLQDVIELVDANEVLPRLGLGDPSPDQVPHPRFRLRRLELADQDLRRDVEHPDDGGIQRLDVERAQPWMQPRNGIEHEGSSDRTVGLDEGLVSSDHAHGVQLEQDGLLDLRHGSHRIAEEHAAVVGHLVGDRDQPSDPIDSDQPIDVLAVVEDVCPPVRPVQLLERSLELDLALLDLDPEDIVQLVAIARIEHELLVEIEVIQVRPSGNGPPDCGRSEVLELDPPGNHRDRREPPQVHRARSGYVGILLVLVIDEILRILPAEDDADPGHDVREVELLAVPSGDHIAVVQQLEERFEHLELGLEYEAVRDVRYESSGFLHRMVRRP